MPEDVKPIENSSAAESPSVAESEAVVDSPVMTAPAAAEKNADAAAGRVTTSNQIDESAGPAAEVPGPAQEQRVNVPSKDDLDRLWETIAADLKNSADQIEKKQANSKKNQVKIQTIGHDVGEKIIAFFNEYNGWRKHIIDSYQQDPSKGNKQKQSEGDVISYYNNRKDAKDSPSIASVKTENQNGAQPFYSTSVTRNNLFLVIRKDTAKFGYASKSQENLITINPCYQPSFPKAQSAVKDYTLGLREDLMNLTDSESGSVDLNFMVKVNFTKFGSKGASTNYDIPELLREGDGYSVSVKISSGEDKKVLISLGNGQNPELKITFSPDKRKAGIILPEENEENWSNFWTREHPFPKVQFKNLDDKTKPDISDIWFPNVSEGNRESQLPDIKISDANFRGATELETALLTNWPQFDSDTRWWILPDVQEEGSCPVLGRVLSMCLGIAILHDIDNASGENPSEKTVFNTPLPGAEVHRPARQVDLRPFRLQGQLENDALYYSTPALNSLAMALNSGDHVILTGPPGSGKTVLAKKIPYLIGKPHLLCTASPDWTTNELIGRYMPVAQKDGDALLEFEPGFFLQAIESGAWLIIDELNRADIDSCLGPLFSVLSGHWVWLPYKTEKREKEEFAEDEPNDNKYIDKSPQNAASDNTLGNGEMTVSAPNPSNLYTISAASSDSKIVAIMGKAAEEPFMWKRVGICLESDNKGLDSDTYWYKVPEDFRIICTMNDSDAGMLNQLSYALQRRFSVIRVEAPPSDKVQDFITDKVGKVFVKYSQKPDPKDEKKRNFLGRNVPEKGVAVLSRKLSELFASKKDEDLMQLRVVGFGQVKDIITMVIEGISCSKSYNFNPTESEIENLVVSLLANGVVMKVFPQLPAFICNRDEEERQETFLPALQCIARVFVNTDYHQLTADKNELKIKKDEKKSLLKYLEDELWLLFRNQHVPWKPYWEYAKVFAEVDKMPDEGGEEYKKDIRTHIANAKILVKGIDFLWNKLDKLEADFSKNNPSAGDRTPQTSVKNGDGAMQDAQG